ncbi:MAG: sensor histidine kinase, partial [Alphaproteobacteria bacterium]|nr:sensor histidine kinase [Alphaproteobacteria bacterium]
DQLFRVLVNLLRNAAEAGASRIGVRGEQEPGVLAVLIEDDGPGLPEAVHKNLFRPFVSSERNGSGLGLAIARDLMRAHGGDIELVATGAEGTTFRLVLPHQNEAPAPAVEQDRAHAAPSAAG